MEENKNKYITEKKNSLFDKLNLFYYVWAILFISCPIFTFIKIYSVEAINEANRTHIEVDLMFNRTPYIAIVPFKTYIFAILISFIGYVLLSWGRKR